MKRYVQFLEHNEIQKIHEATLRIMETIGISTQSQKLKKMLLDYGCNVENDRVKFPAEIVENLLKKTPSKFLLYGRDGQTVLELGKKKAYTQSCSGTAYVMDLNSAERRPYLLQDAVEMTRLADRLPNIDIVACGMPKDIVPHAYMTIEIATLIQNTLKPLRLPIESAAELDYILELFSIVSNSMKQFREKPFIYLEVSPLSPLNFATEPAEALIKLAENGIPIGLIPCPMMGATSPMTLVGTVAQHNAEILAGAVISQMVNPGVPVILSPRITLMDMRTGINLWAPPESAIAAVCSIQLAQFYNIPVSTLGFSTAAKNPDEQSGYERCYNALMSVLAGVDVLSTGGAIDNALTACYAQLVIDDEISLMLKRALNPLKITDETLAVDILNDVIKNNSTFLLQEHTVRHLHDVSFMPLGERNTFEKWAEKKETIEQKARQKAKEILHQEHHPLFNNTTAAEIEKVVNMAKERFTVA